MTHAEMTAKIERNKQLLKLIERLKKCPYKKTHRRPEFKHFFKCDDLIRQVIQINLRNHRAIMRELEKSAL